MPRLAAVEAVTIAALPAIAWLAARLVDDGALRLGVMCIGVAPAEIATVALTTAALGETATAAVLLVASTVVTALLAAPVLTVLAGGAEVHSGELLVTLVAVVIVPMALGVAARSRLTAAVEKPAGNVATGAVVVLVALVASQVVLDRTLVGATVALVVIIVAGGLLGTGLGRLAAPRDRSAILLGVSMRDFAVAAGIAASAFGPAATAPLGAYGILVMVWGSLVTARRRRQAAPR